MIHAYNKYYLDDVMSAMGAMFDYAVNACGQGMELFHFRFLASGVAGQIEMRNPKYLSGLSGIEMAQEVLVKTGCVMSAPNDRVIDQGSAEYWTGWTLAYLQWYLNVSFSVLQQRGMGISELYSNYGTLHEADLSKTVEIVRDRLVESYKKDNPLRAARKNAGLTQEELASLTGSSLSAIRAYEQGQLSISKAAAESVLKICQEIGCSLSSILSVAN